MDKKNIELQAKLDEAKSEGNINADIATLEENLDKIEIQVKIDSDAFSNMDTELEKPKKNLKDFLSIAKNIISELNNSLATIKKHTDAIFNVGK